MDAADEGMEEDDEEEMRSMTEGGVSSMDSVA